MNDEAAGRHGAHASPHHPTPISRYRALVAFLLGALSVLGFAPFYLFPLPVIGLALLFRLWQRAHSRRMAAALGFAYGFGFFAAGVSWVYISMHDFGGMPLPLGVAATLLLAAFLALFPALAGWLQGCSRNSGALKVVLLMPAVWVFMEWTRGWVLTGFPWLAVGYSQVPYSPLAGIAPVLGVYGVSLAVAFSAGILAWLELGRPGSRTGLWLFALTLLWLAGWGLKQIDWTQPEGAPLGVALLQGNIAQDIKWQEERRQTSFDNYRRLTLAAQDRLVVLPETALPMFYHEVPPDYLDELANHVRRNNGDLIIGVPEYLSREEYYNSAFSLGASPSQSYRKFHLVPFGEYIPLRPLLAWVMDLIQIPLSDFARGARVQQPMRVAGQRIAVDICYEDVFGEEIIGQLPQATMLVNLSNDAWFGRSIGPEQHLQIAQTRALEAGRYMLRATNTGVTAIIDQRGEVIQRAPQFVATTLRGQAQGYTGATPYVRFGNMAALICAALMLAAGGWPRSRHAAA
jgi:apolipoprotein N-acyltransferase